MNHKIWSDAYEGKILSGASDLTATGYADGISCYGMDSDYERKNEYAEAYYEGRSHRVVEK